MCTPEPSDYLATLLSEAGADAVRSFWRDVHPDAPRAPFDMCRFALKSSPPYLPDSSQWPDGDAWEIMEASRLLVGRLHLGFAINRGQTVPRGDLALAGLAGLLYFGVGRPAAGIPTSEMMVGFLVEGAEVFDPEGTAFLYTLEWLHHTSKDTELLDCATCVWLMHLLHARLRVVVPTIPVGKADVQIGAYRISIGERLRGALLRAAGPRGELSDRLRQFAAFV